MNLGMQVGLGPGHIVLAGDPGPPPPKGHIPQCSAHLYCAQTAGCIKMPLGTEVGLHPSDIVFGVDPALSPKGGRAPPHFWPMFVVAKRLDGSRCHLVQR